MPFTALHRLLGHAPGPVTEELLDEAVAAATVETDDLDWKSKLPPLKGLGETDFPKDIAAMANRGGGTIVYGVEETAKAATGRSDVGEVDERQESALRSVAISAIHPPVFNLGLYRLGEDGNRALVVVVPSTDNGPHLIYRGEYFGAPIRNDADTVWMKEQQIEAMYRARIEARRYSTDALDQLYDEAAAGRPVADRAWMIAVARPQVPIPNPTKQERALFSAILQKAQQVTMGFSNRDGRHPFEGQNVLAPRPGLRRRQCTNAWGNSIVEAWVSVHHDWAVSIAYAVGGHPTADPDLNPHGGQIQSGTVEATVSDLLALIRVVGARVGGPEYDARIGIEYAGPDMILIETVDQFGRRFTDSTVPLARYTPVTFAVQADSDDAAFLEQVREAAADCVNQGGITALHVILEAPR